jgi:hypothetical protein
MNIKEKPLIDAVDRLGPLPNFLFSNPVVGGFFSMIMCAVFGGVIMLFQSAGRGEVNVAILFEWVRGGAIAGIVVGAVIHVGIAVSALFQKEEAQVRLSFVFGGWLGVGFLAMLDWIASDSLREWLETLGPIV